MLQALTVSYKALPACRPNPPIGCVLTKNDRVVSEGFTQAYGNNHAEVDALNQYQGAMDDVTAYVTLEPCSFIGKTPACADTIIKSGIKHVVVAILDPDPRNSGKGIKMLKDAGVLVEIGIGHEEVTNFLTPYLIR